MLLVSIRWLGTIVLLVVFTGREVFNDLPAIGRNLGYVYLMGTIGLGGFGTLIYFSAYTTSAVNIGIIQGACLPWCCWEVIFSSELPSACFRLAG